MTEYPIKTYENIPSWIKKLSPGENIMVYFPRKISIVHSKVVSNIIPKSSDYFAILTVSYKLDNIEHQTELLYDDYYMNEPDTDASWSAYQIM
jgi:hypothetical protein